MQQVLGEGPCVFHYYLRCRVTVEALSPHGEAHTEPPATNDRTRWVRACSVASDSLWPHGFVAHPAPLSMGFSRQPTGAGCHALLQGIFPTQGSNPHLLRGLLHWQADSWPPSHLGSPLTELGDRTFSPTLQPRQVLSILLHLVPRAEKDRSQEH